MSQPVHLDEAIEAIRRDPTRPVRIAVDSRLTIEVRAVEPERATRKSAADAFREIGRWEGEAGETLEALFAERRKGSNRSVDELL